MATIASLLRRREVCQGRKRRRGRCSLSVSLWLGGCGKLKAVEGLRSRMRVPGRMCLELEWSRGWRVQVLRRSRPKARYCCCKRVVFPFP